MYTDDEVWLAVQLLAYVHGVDPLTACEKARVIGATWGETAEQWLVRNLRRIVL